MRGNNIVYNNKNYDSLSELADAFNINRCTLRYRLKKGMTMDEALSAEVVYKKSSSITLNKKRYPTLNAVAKAYDMDLTILKGRLEKMSLEKAVTIPVKEKNQPIIFQGDEYKSKKEFAKKFSIPYHELRRFLESNRNVPHDIFLEKIVNKYNNKK